jgi:CRISPR-associated protein Cmr5
MHSQEQKYAAKIFEQISEYPGHLPEDSIELKRYGSMAHKLPILVRQAGLVQALAFVQSRKKQSYDRLLEHLAECVGEGSATQLAKHSREVELSEYIFLTERVMLALKWYKRFAQSILKVEATDEDAGGPQ